MTSIGNDIVALNNTNPERTNQKKFYSKILTESETNLFENNNLALSFENFVWLAWSIKESVYKFYQRSNHHANFSPAKIILKKIQEPIFNAHINFLQHESVSFNNKECVCCEAIFDNAIYYSRSIINNNDFIFTVVNNKDCFKNVFWGIQNIMDDSYTTQSTAVRSFISGRLAAMLPDKNFTIEKSSFGYPYLNRRKNIPVSFAHHGNFTAYSFLLHDDVPAATNS